jgi:hypothetical protein
VWGITVRRHIALSLCHNTRVTTAPLRHAVLAGSRPAVGAEGSVISRVGQWSATWGTSNHILHQSEQTQEPLEP